MQYVLYNPAENEVVSLQ